MIIKYAFNYIAIKITTIGLFTTQYNIFSDHIDHVMNLTIALKQFTSLTGKSCIDLWNQLSKEKTMDELEVADWQS